MHSHILCVPGDLSKIIAAACLIIAARRIQPADLSAIHESSSKVVLKRAADLAMLTLLLPLALPMMLVIAVAIKLDSKGPVLFRQKRYGFKGKTFVCLNSAPWSLSRAPSTTHGGA